MRVLLLLFAFLSACQRQEKTNPAVDSYPAVNDSLQKKYLINEINNESSTFNLPVLYHGADSFEIRIRPWHAFNPEVDLFVFKSDSSGWKGYHYHTKYYSQLLADGRRINASGEIVSEKPQFTALEVLPICGWKKFEDSISYFGIKSLPTQDSIVTNKHPGMLDGSGFDIEIATNKSYRHLDYHFYGNEGHIECLNVYNLVGMIQRQLDDAYFWPSKNPFK